MPVFCITEGYNYVDHKGLDATYTIELMVFNKLLVGTAAYLKQGLLSRTNRRTRVNYPPHASSSPVRDLVPVPLSCKHQEVQFRAPLVFADRTNPEPPSPLMESPFSSSFVMAQSRISKATDSETFHGTATRGKNSFLLPSAPGGNYLRQHNTRGIRRTFLIC
ncbi:hypothetical protein RRG08_047432 [Elysia crispata]|uniref:Uncharacterized protein n=1 Tax=Elysia crispata TaxID=231223 RepID=A0AAE0YVG6_9GAST|nr:hypothetical protein RRG08_047432 [Elysia crispata]